VAVPVAVPVAARVVVTGAVVVAVLKIAPPFTTSHQSPGGSQKLRFASCVWLFTWWWVPSGESESYKSVTVWSWNKYYTVGAHLTTLGAHLTDRTHLGRDRCNEHVLAERVRVLVGGIQVHKVATTSQSKSSNVWI
jgi:hypothetical protein